MEETSMCKRICIDGELVTEDEVKANFPKGAQIKDLYMVEMYYREPINKHYYNGNDNIRALRTLKEALVTPDLESAIDILTEWMDVPPEKELLKPYDEISPEYKSIWASKEKFEQSWELSKERHDLLKTAIQVLRNGEVESGRFLKIDLDGLFGESNHDTFVVAHDLGLCDKNGDPLVVYEKEVLAENYSK